MRNPKINFIKFLLNESGYLVLVFLLGLGGPFVLLILPEYLSEIEKAICKGI